MSIMNQEFFARQLFLVHDYFHAPTFDVDHYSRKVMEAFLFFGSDTPDNKNCHANLYYGSALLPAHFYTLYGFRLRHKPIFVHDLLNCLQASPLPPPIHSYYPDLTPAEWAAALLLASKVAQAFTLRSSKNKPHGWNVASQYFARKLWSLYDQFDMPDFDVARFNHRIMQAFLKFDWNNPGNQSAHQLLEYGKMLSRFEDGFVYGFKIKGKPIMLGNLLNEIEALPPLDTVMAAFPDLTQAEWQALTRMATMLVLTFSPVSG